MRLGMRRFTRLTNAFSKKLANHLHMLSLYFVHYNFCRIHKTLRVTPAMEAGIETTARDCEWIVGLIDGRAPKPDRPKTYRKRQKNPSDGPSYLLGISVVSGGSHRAYLPIPVPKEAHTRL